MINPLTENEITEIILSYPTAYSIQDPLLKYIYENRDEHNNVKSIDTYEPLADYFSLSSVQRKRTYHDIYGNEQNRVYWRSLVYQAKESLHIRYISMGPKGIWGLTQQGIEKAEKILKNDQSSTDIEYFISEGKEKKVYSTKYERSTIARKVCLEANGYNCSVCNINFEEVYGDIGKQFIHVHHIVPISSNKNHKINPATELTPVCPNCHSMLHRKTPPFTIDEMKEIKSQK